jgi:hypothetical protein
MATQQELSWPLAQASPQRVAQLRAECRQLVRRRALLSAGVAALPVPGLDVLSDLHLFTRPPRSPDCGLNTACWPTRPQWVSGACWWEN